MLYVSNRNCSLFSVLAYPGTVHGYDRLGNIQLHIKFFRRTFFIYMIGFRPRRFVVGKALLLRSSISLYPWQLNKIFRTCFKFGINFIWKLFQLNAILNTILHFQQNSTILNVIMFNLRYANKKVRFELPKTLPCFIKELIAKNQMQFYLDKGVSLE